MTQFVFLSGFAAAGFTQLWMNDHITRPFRYWLTRRLAAGGHREVLYALGCWECFPVYPLAAMWAVFVTAGDYSAPIGILVAAAGVMASRVPCRVASKWIGWSVSTQVASPANPTVVISRGARDMPPEVVALNIWG